MQQRRLAAIMFTDIVGYTSLMSKNEKDALQTIQVVRDVLKPLIEEYNGKWQKEIGDGTLSSFSSAVDAVNCAIDFQRSLGEESFKVRIGIHVGEVTMTEDDIFGDGVNIASRIEPLAPPGGVYITDRVYEDIANKPGLNAVLVGTRSLKNVERPINIYTLAGEGLPEPPSQPVGNSVYIFLKDIWARRMLQISALYILLAFLIVQIVSWVVDKFLLSPNWFDFTWILLLSLLPSVAFMAYYHGRSGMDKWVKKEKIFVSVNFAISVIILFFLFQGKDLGATTKVIMTEDEQGNTIERIVPKEDFIKNIAVFDFENRADDEDLEWLSTGLNIAILKDFNQDKFFRTKGTESFYGELIRNKIKATNNVPVQLQRKIARDFRLDYILAGSFDKTDDGFQINSQLYETENGKLLTEHTFQGPELFSLVDQLTVAIKKDLGIPQSYIENTEDYQVTGLLTPSLPAFREYTLGFAEISFRNNYGNSIPFMLSALEKDPEFLTAELDLTAILMISNQFEQASIHMEKVMDKLYMLPERDQFMAKSLNYYLNEEQEKRIKVIEMWVDLYPDDVFAYDLLAKIHRGSGEPQKAEEVLKSALQIDDNRGNFYVDLADVLKIQGKNEEALSYYELYAETYSNHARSFRLLGDFYFDEGKYQEAEENYEKSLLLSEDNILSMGKLAMIQERYGNFKEAELGYNEALKEASTGSDSMRILTMQMDYFLNLGQIKKVIEIWEQTLVSISNVYPPLVVSIFKATRLYWYFLINEYDTAYEIIRQEEEKFSDAFKDIVAYGYLSYYINRGNLEKAEEAYERMEKYVSKFGSSGSIEKYNKAEILYLKQEYESALEKFNEFKSVNTHFPNDLLEIRIANCYEKLNNFEEAIEILDEILEINPYLASAHLAMAKTLIESGNRNKAREHLDIASQIWENADEEFVLAQEAKALYEQI
jgi:class 3 adenylate cyclase/tetratricopeptide (TPR) repeat protein